MRSFKNNHKRKNFRSNGDRNLNRALENQTLVSTSNFQRKNHRANNQNASRLVEKYNNLGREALSTGDKILSESYFQFSDHYLRILNEREKNQNSSNLNKEKSINQNANGVKEEKIEEKEIASS